MYTTIITYINMCTTIIGLKVATLILHSNNNSVILKEVINN